MIDFTEDQIKRAATTIKVIRLVNTPGMDTVAIKLNCGPTHDELEVARRWALALGYATRGGLTSFEAADAIYHGKKL